jgi:hypothetical protein
MGRGDAGAWDRHDRRGQPLGRFQIPQPGRCGSEFIGQVRALLPDLAEFRSS